MRDRYAWGQRAEAGLASVSRLGAWQRLRDRRGGVRVGGALAQALLQVGACEAPMEGHGGVVVPRLVGEQAPLDRREVGKSLGVSTLRWTIEK